MPTFGLSDIGYRTLEETVTTLVEEIEDNIARYEPRVELLGADEVYDKDGRLSHVAANLRVRDGGEVVRVIVDLQKKSFQISIGKGR